jgi:hypothetical protein
MAEAGITSAQSRMNRTEAALVDELRPAALSHLIKVADEAAAHHRNPLTRLSTALTDVAASSADPYLIIDDLLDGVAHVIAARIPLCQQRDIACQVEIKMDEVLIGWKLK